MLTRVGCAGEPLGPPQIIGGVETYAVLYEVGPEWDPHVGRLAGGGVTLQAQDRAAVLARQSASSF